MPGRVSARAPRSTANKARASSPNKVPAEGPVTSLRTRISSILGDVQRSTTGHRKLVVGLRKIQEACCYEPANTKLSLHDAEDFDEAEFNEEIARCVLRIVTIKKSEPAGDRLVKFLGLFLKHATDLDNDIFREEDEDGGLIFPETPTSRLTSQVVFQIIPLLTAKDKVVRFRCTQIVAHVINTLDSVDDELFHRIRVGLLKRLRDKESSVRVQAVYGLGRLAAEVEVEEDDEDSDDDVAGGILDKLLDVLQNDPSAEVRRALLLNLPFTPATLPFLLERARDLDPGIRRALYSRLLPALGDFRHLSLTHREKLLRWGLRDRDENVKKATAKLFRERWIEDCVRPRDDGDEMKPSEPAEPSSDGLRELLERIDVVNAGNDGGIALDAMKQFWEGRPDYREYITFDDAYWKQLTPESVFIARTFNDFCHQDGASDLLQDKMPEVTKLAYLLQRNVNFLIELVQKSALQEIPEEDPIQQEFVVEQLLHIALTLDYSDEIGRRTMFSLTREALALAELPEECTKLVIEVLRATCGTSTAAEREFCGVVLEAIAEVHDTIMGDSETTNKPEDVDDSFHSARSELSGDATPTKIQDATVVDEEKAVREIMVNMKCLHIAQCMLQNVDCKLEDSSHLVTMLNNLVVPAVRSQEAPIRERGLLCLGLCCLLDKNLADENLTLFLHCFNKGHEALQNIAVQILGDILAAHPSMLFPKTPAAEDGIEQEHEIHKPIHKMFSKGLKSPSAPIQSTTCTALCKLMLSSPSTSITSTGSILNTDDLLKLLVVAYFDPETSGNPALRQTLSYFLPVYCYSRKENMERMGRVTIPVLHWCIGQKEEMDVEAEDEASGDMVALSIVVAHLVDWTDGRRLAVATQRLTEDSAIDSDCDVHLDIAAEALEKVLSGSSKEERKLFISMLGKLHITASSDGEKLKVVSELVAEAVQDKVASDAVARNALNKMQAAIEKVNVQSNKSRAASRSRSIAPSILDDGEDLRSQADAIDIVEASELGDGESTELAVSPIDTPAPSPQKETSRIDRLTSQGETAQKPVFNAESNAPELSPSSSVELMVQIKQEEKEDILPEAVHDKPKPRRGRPKAAASSSAGEATDSPPASQDLNTDMPQASEFASKPSASNEAAEIVPRSPKKRGRPPRATLSDMAIAGEPEPGPAPAGGRTRQPRRTVRASRAAASMSAVVANEGADE